MSHQTSSRRTIVSAVAVLLAAASLAFASPAQAENGSISCTGSVTVQYDPPLGPLPQPTTQEVAARHARRRRLPRSGRRRLATTVFQQEVGCLLRGLGDTLVENEVTYNWNTGATRRITHPVTIVVHAANQLVVTSTGTVTDGLGEGALSERIAVYPDIDIISCLTSGVEQQVGSLTVIIA